MGMALPVSVDLQEETPPGWDRSRCPGCQGGDQGGDVAGSVSERQSSLELGPTGRLAHLALVDADLQRRLSAISHAEQAVSVWGGSRGKDASQRSWHNDQGDMEPSPPKPRRGRLRQRVSVS